ncbi:MAG: hypothetical protein ACK5V3_15740 [Bdellovibrionales bacterium]
MNICFAIVFAFFSSINFAADLNREAFDLYKQKKFAQAEKLLLKETKQNPQKHFAWLNLARVTFAKVKDNPEIELFECLDLEKTKGKETGLSVGYKVLHFLSRAVELNQREILEKLSESDPHFDDFKNEEQYKRWLKAVNLPSEQAKVEAFLISNEWIPYQNNMDQNPEINNWNTYFVFSQDFKIKRMLSSEVEGAPGKQPVGQEWAGWKVKKDGTLEIDRKGKKFSTKINRSKKLNENFFFSAQIPTSNEIGDALLLGPRIGDCGEFND